MKTDRELLELAAKAAGYTVTAWVEDANGVDRFQVYSEKSMWLEWNPRDDDGDAFRLQVKLKLAVSNYGGGTEVWFDNQKGGEDRITQDFGEDGGLSELEACRLAILLAAAETWRAIQCGSICQEK